MRNKLLVFVLGMMVAVLFRIMSVALVGVDLNGVMSMTSIMSGVDLGMVLSILFESTWTALIALVTGLVYFRDSIQAQFNNTYELIIYESHLLY